MVERWAGVGQPPPARHHVSRHRPSRTVRLCGAVTECNDATRTVELDVWLENEDGSAR
jgi:hypothetical protein